MKISLGYKVQKAERKDENMEIQADRLIDREVRMKFQAKLLVKMNELVLNREEMIQETRDRLKDVWLKFKKGVIGAAVKVCG